MRERAPPPNETAARRDDPPKGGTGLRPGLRPTPKRKAHSPERGIVTPRGPLLHPRRTWRLGCRKNRPPQPAWAPREAATRREGSRPRNMERRFAVLSCPALPCPVLSCPVLSCPILSYPVLSYPVLCCAVLCCPVLSCAVLCCAVLSCLSWEHQVWAFESPLSTTQSSFGRASIPRAFLADPPRPVCGKCGIRKREEMLRSHVSTFASHVFLHVIALSPCLRNRYRIQPSLAAFPVRPFRRFAMRDSCFTRGAGGPPSAAPLPQTRLLFAFIRAARLMIPGGTKGVPKNRGRKKIQLDHGFLSIIHLFEPPV